MTEALGRSFASLSIPNFRRYFSGQLVSLSGNWMQMIAEMWVVLSLTGSGLAVGVTTALQFLPMLIFGAWGGLIADRVPKRRLLLLTQTLHMIAPLTMLTLALEGVLVPWMVFALVFLRGCVNSVDYPTRQAFVMEMVGSERVVNAVSLNSVLVHGARVIGPAFAGVLIATVGVEPCFALNAASFAFMIWVLAGMDTERLRPAEVAAPESGAVRAGLRYVRGAPELWIPLGLMAIVGTLGYNFQAVLPLLARFTFDGGPSTYAALVAAMGVGAIVGALVNGARGSVTPMLLVGAAFVFGVLSLLAAGAPTLALEVVALGTARRGDRDAGGERQLIPPARLRAEHAGPGDGPLLDRLPRLDSDRRPALGLALGGGRPPRRPGDGRDRGDRRRRARPDRLRPGGADPARRPPEPGLIAGKLRMRRGVAAARVRRRDRHFRSFPSAAG